MDLSTLDLEHLLATLRANRVLDFQFDAAAGGRLIVRLAPDAPMDALGGSTLEVIDTRGVSTEPGGWKR